MMRRIVMAVALCNVAFTPSFAQTAPSPDTQAILDALQSINNRLTALENANKVPPLSPDIAAPGSPGAQIDTPNAPAAEPPPAGMVAKAGWLIGMGPSDWETYADAPVAMIEVGNSGFDLNDHKKILGTTTEYSYQGKAVFNAYEAGVYTLGFKGSFRSSSTSCIIRFGLNGEDVVTYKRDYIDSNEPMFVGNTKSLEAGSYEVEFYVICDTYAPEKRKLTPVVKTPSDLAPRQFEDNELFHYVKERASKVGGGGITTKIDPSTLQVGDKLEVVGLVNVRDQPSVNAAIIDKLQVGEVITLNQANTGQEWINVPVGNSGRIGYVKFSALLQNAKRQ